MLNPKMNTWERHPETEHLINGLTENDIWKGQIRKGNGEKGHLWNGTSKTVISEKDRSEYENMKKGGSGKKHTCKWESGKEKDEEGNVVKAAMSKRTKKVNLEKEHLERDMWTTNYLEKRLLEWASETYGKAKLENKIWGIKVWEGKSKQEDVKRESSVLETGN